MDLRGVTGAEAKARSLAALAAVGLADKTGVLPRDLSGGQKQRVAIARALVAEPEIILADEPTAALDSETGRSVIALLRHLAVTQGRTVVLVTHGGYELTIAPENLSLLRVVEAIDGEIFLNDCLHRPDSCGRSPLCSVHRVWEVARNQLRATLDGISLAGLVDTEYKQSGKRLIKP